MTGTQEVLAKAIQRSRERNVILPTFQQMANPELVPAKLREKLSKEIGLQDVHPLNLFRICWKNEPTAKGGGFAGVNYLELPRELTGIKATVLILLGKFFPTGSHKVGATYGTLAGKLVAGQFDPTRQKALWPSTGNYCRGGAYNAHLLGCPSMAVLPEEMSPERFEWLEQMGSEIIRTPGGESNVKEIFDRVAQLSAEQGDKIVVLNQFSEFGNSLWHFTVTGPAMEEAFNEYRSSEQRLSGSFMTQGSAGTMAAGEYLRDVFPRIRVGAGEAQQCPTLLCNGYGEHRIEGIGDKHVPWIFNIKNIDFVAGIDDHAVMRLMRLFNEPKGRDYLAEKGIDKQVLDQLGVFGLSSIANIVGSIKLSKYYEFGSEDVVITVATDSMELYMSRLTEARESSKYSHTDAAVDFERYLQGITTDYVLEPTMVEKRRMHNLKYFTWVEQQGMSTEELNAQWYDRGYWKKKYDLAREWDAAIESFNEQTGTLKDFLKE